MPRWKRTPKAPEVPPEVPPEYAAAYLAGFQRGYEDVAAPAQDEAQDEAQDDVAGPRPVPRPRARTDARAAGRPQPAPAPGVRPRAERTRTERTRTDPVQGERMQGERAQEEADLDTRTVQLTTAVPDQPGPVGQQDPRDVLDGPSQPPAQRLPARGTVPESESESESEPGPVSAAAEEDPVKPPMSVAAALLDEELRADTMPMQELPTREARTEDPPVSEAVPPSEDGSAQDHDQRYDEPSGDTPAEPTGGEPPVDLYSGSAEQAESFVPWSFEPPSDDAEAPVETRAPIWSFEPPEEPRPEMQPDWSFEEPGDPRPEVQPDWSFEEPEEPETRWEYEQTSEVPLGWAFEAAEESTSEQELDLTGHADDETGAAVALGAEDADSDELDERLTEPRPRRSRGLLVVGFLVILAVLMVLAYFAGMAFSGVVQGASPLGGATVLPAEPATAL